MEARQSMAVGLFPGFEVMEETVCVRLVLSEPGTDECDEGL
jgi:hypothetical protein